MLQLFIDDHFVAEQVTVSPVEHVELVTLADEFDADRQMRICRLRSIPADRAVVAKAIMRVLGDGVDEAVILNGDEAVILGGADQLAVERLAPSQRAQAALTNSVGRLHVDAQHPDFAMLDGKTIGHGQTFDWCGD